MKTLWAFAVASITCVACAGAADGPIQTTTELGITVEPDDIFDAIHETSQFWPPLRKRLNDGRLDIATPAAQRGAAAVIRRVNDELYQRLMSDDESRGADLIRYTAARIRIFRIYRTLRETIDDDRALLALKTRWDHLHREARDLDAAEQPARRAEIVAGMRQAMLEEGVEPERIERAMRQWRQLGLALQRMNATEAGQAMLRVEDDVRHGDAEVAQLMREIMATSDWAQIVKPAKTTLSARDFLPAWEAMHLLQADVSIAQQPMAAEAALQR